MNKTIMNATHNNSLRSLISQIANITSKERSKIEVHTRVPLIYEFDDTMNTTNHYVLGNY